MGTGPFKFTRWEPNREIVLEANEDYYEGRPFLSAVSFKIVLGERLEERFTEFLKGNLEETGIPSEKTEEVRLNPITESINESVSPRSASFTLALTHGSNRLTIAVCARPSIMLST